MTFSSVLLYSVFAEQVWRELLVSVFCLLNPHLFIWQFLSLEKSPISFTLLTSSTLPLCASVLHEPWHVLLNLLNHHLPSSVPVRLGQNLNGYTRRARSPVDLCQVCCSVSLEQVQGTETKPSDTQTGYLPGARYRRKQTTSVVAPCRFCFKGHQGKSKEAESTGLISETQSNTGSRMIFAFLWCMWQTSYSTGNELGEEKRTMQIRGVVFVPVRPCALFAGADSQSSR